MISLTDRHREKRLEIKRRDHRRRFWNILTVALLVLMVVFIGFYVDRVTPIRVDGGIDEAPTTVSFTRGQIQWLDQNYERDLENGFCLFGRIDESDFVVEDLEFVDNPWSQSKYSMRFNCVPQILVRSSQLVMDGDYRFLGIVHTHPNTASPSLVDLDTFNKVDEAVELFGVYNGEELNVYDRPGGPPIKKLLRAK